MVPQHKILSHEMNIYFHEISYTKKSLFVKFLYGSQSMNLIQRSRGWNLFHMPYPNRETQIMDCFLT